jgi:hypothetical protein
MRPGGKRPAKREPIRPTDLERITGWVHVPAQDVIILRFPVPLSALRK